MCRTEVTNAQWTAVMETAASNCDVGCEDDHPVQTVTWEMAASYLNRLTDRENALLPPDAQLTRCYTGPGDTWVPDCTGYRLPTEAEWEYAARAGTQTAYSFGDDPAALGEYAWYQENSDDRTHPVGEKRPNSWGLFDMHGNVEEWVWDRYDPWYYGDGSATREPRGPADNEVVTTIRGRRGGAFAHVAAILRSGARQGAPARLSDVLSSASETRGFRCARGTPAPSAELAEPLPPPDRPPPEPAAAAPPASAGATKRPASATKRPRKEVALSDTFGGRFEVEGALDGELVRGVARDHIDDFRRCFNSALARDPDASGTVEVHFEIASNGRVSTSLLAKSTMRDPEVGPCITRAVVGWTFPSPEDGGTTRVKYRFVLEPG
jgi:hypothetical protein